MIEDVGARWTSNVAWNIIILPIRQPANETTIILSGMLSRLPRCRFIMHYLVENIIDKKKILKREKDAFVRKKMKYTLYI